MKRSFLSIMIVLIGLILLACNGDGNDLDDQGRVTISFFGWGSAEEQANFQTLVDRFMAENDDIRVVYSAVSADMYMRNLNNQMNNLPDVFYIPDTEFMPWADSGRLLPLDSYLSEAELERVWSRAISHYRYDRDSFTLGEGPLFALPKDLGPFAMVMNVDLFERIVAAKGLDMDRPDPSVPMTFSAFADMLESLKCQLRTVGGEDTCEGGQRIFGVTHYELAAAIYSNNANFFNDDATQQTITDPNFIEALQYIANLHLVHGVMPSPSEQANLNGFQRFMNGGGIFSFMGPWDMKGFWENINFEFDLIPLPVGPAEGAKSTAWVGSMGIAVSERSRQREAAVRLAKYLTIEEASQRMAYQLGQSVPNIIDIAEDDFLNNVELNGRQIMPLNKVMFLDIIRHNAHIAGHPRPTYFTYENIWYDDLFEALLPVFNGQITAQAFVNQYATTIQRDLDESNSYLN